MKILQRSTILAGGFLGPFAGQSLATILPEFADSFGITLSQAAMTMSFYLFPFAVVMLFSNRLVASLAPSRVAIVAFAATSVAALLLVFTPWWPLFLIGFTIMGVANAFTSPILLVILKSLTPVDRLGGVLGTYTAMQSLGILSAPLVAGLAATVEWRIIFILVAAVSALISIIGLPFVEAAPRGTSSSAETVNWWVMSVHMFSCLTVGFGVIGLGFLTALHAGDRFQLDSVGRGAVVMCGGLMAFLFSRLLGSAADRSTPRKVLIVSSAVAALALFLLPFAPTALLLATVWGVTVAAAQGIQTMVNLMVLKSPGGSSLLSTVQAFRYFGSASTPVILLTVYTTHSLVAFFIPAACIICSLLLQSMVGRVERKSHQLSLKTLPLK